MLSRILKPGIREMSSGDTAWLRMDSPTNLMIITGVFVLKQPVSLHTLREVISRRFAGYERFRMCARRDMTGSYWEKDPDFAIENHVVVLDVHDELDQAGLEDLASRMASAPLAHDRPLWQYQLIEHYRGGSAVICRIHHCYADGIALIRVLLSMTDTEPDPAHHAGAPPQRRHVERGLLDQVFHDARALRDSGRRAGEELLHEGVELTRHPGIVAELARMGVDFAADLARMVFKPRDTQSRYRGELGPAKRVAWADPLPLDEVKAVGKAHGCTVNDVLLASVAGALRSWLEAQGDAVDGMAINATVPVNLRPHAGAGDLGNKFGLVFLEIPIGIRDPVERLHAVHRSMRTLKQSYQPQVSLGLLALVGLGPSTLQRPVLEMFSSKATAVMTNVPGPQAPLYLAGAEIGQLLCWVPQSGTIGLGVSILSYNGAVQFGLMSDRNLVPDPGQVIRRVGDEFEQLVLVTLMRPWIPPDPGRDAVTAGDDDVREHRRQ